MSNYELTGTIIVLQDTQAFPSGFAKREFVIETDGKYPQQIKLEMVKDNCVRLDSFQVGQQATVNFDVRGNEYNGKHYVNLVAWKIERVGAAPEKPIADRPVQKSLPPAPGMADAVDEDDDDQIPF